MPVYVDDMKAPVRMGGGRVYVFCHMVADTEEELHAIADRIGVARRWYQYPEKSRWPHYDIVQAKRALAVAAGAIEVEMRQTPAIARRCIAAIHAAKASANA